MSRPLPTDQPLSGVVVGHQSQRLSKGRNKLNKQIVYSLIFLHLTGFGSPFNPGLKGMYTLSQQLPGDAVFLLALS